MMQPEDIIQQKEWQQLTAAEKKIVEPLASTEGEFNMLKKMLMIAREEVDDTPKLNPAVQQQLHSYLRQPGKKNRMVFWYAAAASIIVTVLVAVFWLQQPKRSEIIANDPPVNNNSLVQNKAGDSLMQQVPPPNISRHEDRLVEMVKQQNKPRPVQNKPAQPVNNYDLEQNIAQVNTSGKENETLLAFVTEVY